MQILFTSFYTLIILITSGIAAPGCRKDQPSATQVRDTTRTPLPQLPGPDTSSTGAKKYLALGDSYTIGQSVRINERYPHLTVAMLRQQGIAMEDPRYIAQTGWSTIALEAAIQQNEPLGTFDIVTLLIGVNDQYQGLDIAGYRTRFTQLLNKAISLAGNRSKRVVVLSIPDYSATPFVNGSNKEIVSKAIDEFNKANLDISTQHNITYIDITPLTREAANDLSLLASDQLHYSAKEHQLWANKLAPLIKEALK